MVSHKDPTMVNFEASTTPLMGSRADFEAATTPTMVNFDNCGDVGNISNVGDGGFLDNSAGVLFCSFLFTHILLFIFFIFSFYLLIFVTSLP
jgi:hypothetical protein